MTEDKIAILVDSCSDVPADFMEAHHIFMVPMMIMYKDEVFLDKVTISPEEVYAKMSVQVPKTATPTGEIISATFEKIKAEGYTHVIVVCISSGLSGTFQHIKLMSRLTDLNVHVIDTKSIGIGSGLSAMYATELLEAGYSFDEIISKTEAMTLKTKVFIYIPTLEYLAKGGRIGKVAGLMGNLLNVKPIVSCDDQGDFYPIAKARGEAKTLKKLLALVEEYVGIHQNVYLAIPDGDGKANADLLADELHTHYPKAHGFYRGNVSPALVVHTGPGMVGVGVQLRD